MSQEPSAPLHCGEHGEAIAGTCARCGRFVCAQCTPPRADLHAPTCASCQAKHEVRLANTGIDLLLIRCLGEPLIHVVPAFIVFAAGEGEGRRGFVLIAACLFELLVTVLGVLTFLTAVKRSARALTAIRRQQVLGVIAMGTCAAGLRWFGWAYGFVLLAGTGAYMLFAALPTLAYLRYSREPARFFTR